MFSSVFVVILCFTMLHVAKARNYTGEYVYSGCYKDIASVQDRSLPYLNEQSGDMDVDMCTTICGDRGFPYAGLEYGRECWCSADAPRYEKLDEGRCDSICAGDKTGDNKQHKCGGAASLSVYVNKDVKQPADTGQPLLCLTMIVKNEAHTILNTINNLHGIIDCWYVLDTGSTDGTQDKIRKELATIPGHIFEEPFIDYSASRNRAMEIAEDEANPVFIVMLSADERIQNPKDLRTFCEKFRYAKGIEHGAYPVLEEAGILFEPVRIKRMDHHWRYKGRVHEYMGPAGDYFPELWRPKPAVQVTFRPTDDDRRMDSQHFIAKVLAEEVEKDPHDMRSTVYLARTLSLLKNHTGSFLMYKHLTEYSRDPEEVYHGFVMMHEEGRLTTPEIQWDIRARYLEKAFLTLPGKRDAPHQLAQTYYNDKLYAMAYVWSSHMIKLAMPGNLDAQQKVLLRQTMYLYEYEGMRLHGFISRQMKEWEGCYRALTEVVNIRKSDSFAENELKECKKHLEPDDLKRIDASMQRAPMYCPMQSQPLECPIAPACKREGPSCPICTIDQPCQVCTKCQKCKDPRDQPCPSFCVKPASIVKMIKCPLMPGGGIRTSANEVCPPCPTVPKDVSSNGGAASPVSMSEIKTHDVTNQKKLMCPPCPECDKNRDTDNGNHVESKLKQLRRDPTTTTTTAADADAAAVDDDSSDYSPLATSIKSLFGPSFSLNGPENANMRTIVFAIIGTIIFSLSLMGVLLILCCCGCGLLFVTSYDTIRFNVSFVYLFMISMVFVILTAGPNSVLAFAASQNKFKISSRKYLD